MFSIQRGQKKEIPVILPKHATAAENFAAEELKTVLEQVFQAETIYLAENSPFIDGCISIGETELMKKNFSQIYDGLETDDCAVACKNNTLFLFGKTDDFSSAGTIYAVYEFAERWLGFGIWLGTNLFIRRGRNWLWRKCCMCPGPILSCGNI